MFNVRATRSIIVSIKWILAKTPGERIAVFGGRLVRQQNLGIQYIINDIHNKRTIIHVNDMHNKRIIMHNNDMHNKRTIIHVNDCNLYPSVL